MRKFTIAIVCATAMMFIFIGCSGLGIEGNYQITRDELKAKIDNEEEFTLIDVREPDEFDEGSIDLAFNLPLGRLQTDIGSKRYWDEQAWDVPSKDAEIIVYSQKGKLGMLAAQILVRMEYTNVKNLYGGYMLWLDPNANIEEEEHGGGGCGG